MRKNIFVILALLAYAVTAQGAVITWNVGTNGFWDVPANWVGGVIPTASDSVLIDGVGSRAKVRTIVNALHVTVLPNAILGITPDGQLSINDSPGEGIYASGEVVVQSGGKLLIEGCGEEGILMYDKLTNEGDIEISDCAEGIKAFGSDTILNQGTIVICDPGSNGILISGSILINHDSIVIVSSSFGLLLINGATAAFSNSSVINIDSSTVEAISIRHHAVLSNEGRISIDEFGVYGVLCYGSVENIGEIEISQTVGDGTGIEIDSFNCCSDPLVGSITNTSSGAIYIDHAETGIHLDHSTTLSNEGEISVVDCTSSGYYIAPRGSAMMTSGSVTTLSDVNDPMVVELEAILDVEQGAEVTADL